MVVTYFLQNVYWNTFWCIALARRVLGKLCAEQWSFPIIGNPPEWSAWIENAHWILKFKAALLMMKNIIFLLTTCINVEWNLHFYPSAKSPWFQSIRLHQAQFNRGIEILVKVFYFRYIEILLTHLHQYTWIYGGLKRILRTFENSKLTSKFLNDSSSILFITIVIVLAELPRNPASLTTNHFQPSTQEYHD